MIYIETTVNMSNCTVFVHFIFDIVMVMAIDFFFFFNERKKKCNDLGIYLLSILVQTLDFCQLNLRKIFR